MYRQALVAAEALPVEVLREMFKYTVDSDDTVATRGIINLVSTRWRNVAIGYPELWTHVQLSWPPDENLKSSIAGGILDRSRHLPFRISATLDRPEIPRSYIPSPYNTRLTSITLHDAFCRDVECIQRFCDHLKSISSADFSVAVCGSGLSNNFRPNMSDISAFSCVQNLTLSKLDWEVYQEYDETEAHYESMHLRCSTLSLDAISLQQAMATLATIPARNVTQLELSGS